MRSLWLVFFVVIQFVKPAHAGDAAGLVDRFYFACKQQVDVPSALYYPTEFANFEAAVNDENNKTNIYELLNKIMSKIYSRIKESHTLNRNIRYCLAALQRSEECEQLNKWVDLEIPKYVSEARQHLALSQSPSDLMSWLSLPRIEANEAMSHWSIYKDVDWVGLTAAEKTLAQGRLSKYIKKAVALAEAKKLKGEISRLGKLRVSFLTVLYLRYQHFLKYKSMLGSVSIMQYLKSSKPNRIDVLAAIDQLELNLKKEESALNQLAVILLASQRANLFDNSLLNIFDYSSLLEEVLTESPKFCPIAGRALDFKDNRNLAIALGVGLPILVGSFMVPPLAGLAVGVTSGVGFAVEQQYELNQEKNRAFDAVYGDDNSISLDEISQTKRSRDMGLVLLPITTGAGSLLISKSVGLRLTAYYSAKSIAVNDFFVERLSLLTTKIKAFSKVDLTKP